MLRMVLVFVAGLLVGANVVYFLMAGRQADPAQALIFQRERSQHELPADTPSASAERIDEVTPTSPPGERSRPSRMPPREVPATTSPATPGADRDRADGGASAVPPAPIPAGAGLIVPVRGVTVAQLSNTFDDARGPGRVHEALDIMAPRGTPVLAVADGTVEKLFNSDRGGLTVYQFEPSGRYAYYYAHLDRYAEELEEGDTLRQGQVIGYVGSTGNASDDAPHLHFAIFVLGPEKRWWEGTAINPYPVLTGKRSL
jgi:murein DD-endopeptidase MepM/ murein hydrolase activator NlpD